MGGSLAARKTVPGAGIRTVSPQKDVGVSVDVESGSTRANNTIAKRLSKEK